jgi:hypothetical protein
MELRDMVRKSLAGAQIGARVAETREINDGLGALVLLNMADAHGGNKAGACERGVSTAAADSFERPRNFAARAAGSYDRRRASSALVAQCQPPRNSGSCGAILW